MESGGVLKLWMYAHNKHTKRARGLNLDVLCWALRCWLFQCESIYSMCDSGK